MTAQHPFEWQMRVTGGETLPVRDDVACLQVVMVNVYFVGDAEGWVLVDTGLPLSATRIVDAAERRFGPGARPDAIVLTHGHFDHVGAIDDLLRRWDVPVYAHRLEMPYLTGRSSYPPPDPTAGGLMAWASPLYPRGPIDLGDRVRALPADGSVPSMPGWRWVHTPGHTPGHVSLFRNEDRTLIAGDAFVCTRQESALAVLTQYKKVHGPPAYFTPDWASAEASVRQLAEMEPEIAATGHGLPMEGDRLQGELADLVEHFDELAVPHRSSPVPMLLAAGALAVGAVALGTALRYRRSA